MSSIQMGLAHHANYPIWFECGRTQFFADLGFSYSFIEKKGLLLPLTEMQCAFFSPLRYEDEIAITTELAEISCARMEFHYEIANGAGAVAARGRTAHAWTDRELRVINIAKRMPELYARLEKAVKTGVKPVESGGK